MSKKYIRLTIAGLCVTRSEQATQMQGMGIKEDGMRMNELSTQISKPMLASQKPVYLENPFKSGYTIDRFIHRISAALRETCIPAGLGVIKQNQKVPLLSFKVSQAPGIKAHFVYRFTGKCGVSDIDRTNRYPCKRIREHMSAFQ